MSSQFGIKGDNIQAQVNDRIEAAHKLMVSQDKSAGKLLSTKVTVKKERTVGDRFPIIDKILSTLGIHIMSRTSDTDPHAVAKALAKFTHEFQDQIKEGSVQRQHLAEIIDAIAFSVLDNETDEKKKTALINEFNSIKTAVEHPEAKKVKKEKSKPKTEEPGKKKGPPVPAKNLRPKHTPPNKDLPPTPGANLPPLYPDGKVPDNRRGSAPMPPIPGEDKVS